MKRWLLDLLGGPELFRKYIASAVRHLMGAISGYLLVVGLDVEVVEKFGSAGEGVLVGLAMYALVQLWSWLDKKRSIE